MDKNTFVNIFKGTDVKADGIWEAQQIGKRCMQELSVYLKSGLSQKEIHDHCEQYMSSIGADGWWTHNDPALVLFGEHTAYSGHLGPDELFNGLVTSEYDLISVDVGPYVSENGGQAWGDICRTFFLKDGKVVSPEETENDDWIEGMKLEYLLHSSMIDFIDEKTTFADLHSFTEKILKEHGYHNCDYHGNYGHTIENHPDDRVTIIPEETRSIAAYGKPITYEPHICRDGGTYGLKHEIMYVFYNGKMREV